MIEGFALDAVTVRLGVEADRCRHFAQICGRAMTQPEPGPRQAGPGQGRAAPGRAAPGHPKEDPR